MGEGAEVAGLHLVVASVGALGEVEGESGAGQFELIQLLEG